VHFLSVSLSVSLSLLFSLSLSLSLCVCLQPTVAAPSYTGKSVRSIHNGVTPPLAMFLLSDTLARQEVDPNYAVIIYAVTRNVLQQLARKPLAALRM
jgi:hypothetical protein